MPKKDCFGQQKSKFGQTLGKVLRALDSLLGGMFLLLQSVACRISFFTAAIRSLDPGISAGPLDCRLPISGVNLFRLNADVAFFGSR